MSQHLHRRVSEFSGDHYVDLIGDDDVLVGTELQLFQGDADKAESLIEFLNRWDEWGQPGPEQVRAALANLPSTC